MLGPVDLMSVVSASSPSAKARDTSEADSLSSSPRLFSADAGASSAQSNSLINKIYKSYSSDGEADPDGRFAADLRTFLSTHGVAFSPDQSVLPQTIALAAQEMDAALGELAWSVDELLQMSMAPVTGGNNLPRDDQTLPSLLSNWLVSAGEPAGSAEADAAANVVTMVAGSRDSSAAPLSSNNTPVLALAGAETLARGATSVLTHASSGDPSVRLAGTPTILQAGAQAEGDPALQAMSQSVMASPAMTTDASAIGLGSAVEQEMMLRSPLPADVTRQATETAQVNPGSQKVASEAANASAFRSNQFNQAAVDGPASQSDLIKTDSSPERNQAIASQLTRPLSMGINGESSVVSSAAQNFALNPALNPTLNPALNLTLDSSQADNSAVPGRSEQRMFATESAQQAQSQAASQSATRSTDGLPRFVMDTGFGQQGWSDSLGKQLLIMSSQGVSSAQIRLDPPELGSLTVKIQMAADQQTSVSFVSPHAMVREALEQQLNRLQDMFRDQGLNLQDVSVSDQSSQQHGDGGSGQQRHGGGSGSASGDRDAAVAAPVMVRSESLIDFYA